VPGEAGQLQEVSLGPDDWRDFEQSVAELAMKSEGQEGQFKYFQEFLKSRDYSVFLDAANIAFYGNSCRPGATDDRFQWWQVQMIYDEAVRKFPS
jgi:hypothetical protein